MTLSIGLFKNSMDTQQVPAGQVIFREGDAAHAMYVVTDGEVEIRIGGHTVDVIVEGGIFGELALIDASPRSGTAVARTDAKIVPINERRFTFLLQQTPQFAIQVMRIMAERLRRKDPRHGPSA